MSNGHATVLFNQTSYKSLIGVKILWSIKFMYFANLVRTKFRKIDPSLVRADVHIWRPPLSALDKPPLLLDCGLFMDCPLQYITLTFALQLNSTCYWSMWLVFMNKTFNMGLQSEVIITTHSTYFWNHENFTQHNLQRYEFW